MKKRFRIALISLLMLTCTNVYACGEIKTLTSNVGKVTTLSESFYQVEIPEGTKEVTLSGTTDYTWVSGFGPRKVSTSKDAELKVDGNACGFGIYTYIVKFKTVANTTPVTPTTPTTPEPETPTTPVEPTIPEENNPSETDTPTRDFGTLLLDKLEILESRINFEPNVHEYMIPILEDINELTINAESTNPDISIKVSDAAKSLQEGTNTIEITLTDSAGNVGLYIITVDKIVVKSDNNFLASLTINGHPLNFDPSINEYTVSIGKKEKSLNITAITESEIARYVILGNENLKDGDAVTIKVTAEDLSTRDYVLHIKVPFNIMDYILYIAIGGVVILAVLVFVIVKTRKNKKKNPTPTEIEKPESTAGVVQEIASQNVEAAPISNPNPISNTGAAELQMLEPTNIEEVPKEETQSESSPTEVFKL